jgi:hypothetical protein
LKRDLRASGLANLGVEPRAYEETIMCPMCMTSAALIAAGSASGVGVLGFIALKWRSFQKKRRAQ